MPFAVPSLRPGQIPAMHAAAVHLPDGAHAVAVSWERLPFALLPATDARAAEAWAALARRIWKNFDPSAAADLADFQGVSEVETVRLALDDESISYLTGLVGSLETDADGAPGEKDGRNGADDGATDPERSDCGPLDENALLEVVVYEALARAFVDEAGDDA